MCNLSMNDSVYGELVANRVTEGKDFGYVPYPGTTGAYLAIVDTFVVSVEAEDGVNAIKFLETIADPKTSLAFNKVKGSVPVRDDVDVSSLPAYQRQASESLWHDKVLLSITHGELVPSEFQEAIYDAEATFVQRHRPGAGDQRSMPVSSPDQIVLCDGKGVCCWPAHPRRTGATLCTHSDHRSLLLRGDAGVGKSTLIQRVSVKAAAQGWRVLL
jgi:hypothetical protein